MVRETATRTTASGFRPITVKFATDCRDCGGSVNVGDSALWKPGFGVVHDDASVCGAVCDPHGREVGVAGSLTSYERATYEDGKSAALADDDSDEAYEKYRASADFRRGWGDHASMCPDGCCGHVAPGVVM